MFSSKTIAVAVAAFFAQSALVAAADCSRTYTVKEGDICDSISSSQQSSTYQLAVSNQGAIDSSCSNLMPGQQICLATTAAEDCTDVYVVQPDDTCDGISSMKNLNSTILRLNNPQINEACDNIYVGEVMCVGSSVKVPPAPAGEIPATVIPATAAPAVPTATKAPSHDNAAAPAPPAPTPAPQHEEEHDENEDEEDEDEEDLPFCDEI
ncbi:hypothetical protein AGABI2DRAFT_196156 [Agaricus bisporus var. bisporus H97]|uniref:hypothetical protein n=1 Tax=Agaricus bisporus var. bisporus (strain H97 / ATCC MYA-4626 / FGSC 10389) TaxID=936046 RepID=UPI00029F76ED|nr:hypothetical protein AGABI2DRAFT_196156 [Agaricus bisporus var. bisporus H97]EKV41856.1 hypothetical protein AGABI2DRAFT_196156 [Agaricus bisporus var. bisporus H97]